MPLYEYQCSACGRRFERIQKFSDPPMEVCPVCGGSVHKLVSSPAFQFKGSGWYVTDYARKDSVSEKVEKELASPEPAAKSDDAKAKKSPAKKTGPQKS
jgi:putative FmdB family regulatory protein